MSEQEAMDDLVERLRRRADDSDNQELDREAANEIERLRRAAFDAAESLAEAGYFNQSRELYALVPLDAQRAILTASDQHTSPSASDGQAQSTSQS